MPSVLGAFFFLAIELIIYQKKVFSLLVKLRVLILPPVQERVLICIGA